jgi:hypothetical protein
MRCIFLLTRERDLLVKTFNNCTNFPVSPSSMPAVSAKMVRRCIDKSERERGCRQICSQTHTYLPRTHKHSVAQGRDVLGHRVHEKNIDLAHPLTQSVALSRKTCRKPLRRDLSAIMEECYPDTGKRISPIKQVMEFCKNWRKSVGMNEA